MRYLTLAWVLVACSAPATQPDLARAEAHERRGETAEAVTAYEVAQRSCRDQQPPQRAHLICTTAYLSAAEVLHRAGHVERAAEYLEHTAKDLADIDPAAAEALYRAGKIHLELGNETRGYTLLWRAVTTYPEEDFAGDALITIVRDARSRAPKDLIRHLTRLSHSLGNTGLGDNLVFHIAAVQNDFLDNPRIALSHYDLLAARYLNSGFRDDAFWRGAHIARRLGDSEGAARRLRKLLATREVAFGTGSYFSIHLDDAQLLLGKVLRDDLRRFDESLAAFARLPKHYPHSILRDDASWQRAVTFHAKGDHRGACAQLGQLRSEFPESKYLHATGAKQRASMGCHY